MAAPACREIEAWLRGGAPPAPSPAVVQEALDRGLAGMLDAAVAGAWPDGPERQRLRSIHLRTVARVSVQLALAAAVVERLSACGLRALPMKGAAVAESAYDSVGQRPMEDVDLLVLDRPLDGLHALTAQGFRLVDVGDHAWSLRDPDGRGTVELHHAVVSCPGLFPADVEGLWSRSRERPGTQVRRVPSPEDLLVQLSLHAAFQHALALGLVQWLDFRQLLRGGVDCARLLEVAAAARASGAVGCALRAAEVVVGAPVPDALRGPLARAMPRGLRLWLEERLARPDHLVGRTVTGLARARWYLARGNRGLLVRLSLAPRVPGQPRRGALATLRTAAGRVWRWSPQASSDWRHRR